MFDAFREAVQILTASVSEDAYGNDVESWDFPTEVDAPALVEPRPSGEPLQDARNQVTSGFTLYLPAGTAVTPQNRVRVRGVVYDVIGEAADWRLGSWEPGLVVQVERTAG